MSLQLQLDELENEIIDARNKAIEAKKDNIKLKRELFVLSEDLEQKKKDVEYHKKNISYLKREIFFIQDMSEELARDLAKSNTEIEYWYRAKEPSLRTVFNNYIRKIKNAYNNFKRSKQIIWENRL